MSKPADPVITALLFEFYVKRIWPFQRRWLKSKIARRCLNCAASVKMIPHNISQICELCETGKVVTNTKKENVSQNQNMELNSIFSQFENKSIGNYDILVLFSGGKDSCYMVRRIKNEYPKMRILTLSIDNNFMSSVAKKNIDEVIPKLDVDHMFIRPKKSFYKKMFRHALLNLNSDGCYGTVDFSDGEFMLDSAKKIAQEKKIPLIACGYSKYQVQNGLKLNSFEDSHVQAQGARQSVAGLKFDDFLNSEEQTLWWSSINAKSEFQPRLLFPLFAWDLEEDQIKKQVQEWGLISRKNQSPIVTNHQLIPLLGVVDVHQLGYSSFEPEFCRMIRDGKAERLHWLYTFEFLEYTAKTGFLVKPVVQNLLQELNLTEQEVGINFEN